MESATFGLLQKTIPSRVMPETRVCAVVCIKGFIAFRGIVFSSNSTRPAINSSSSVRLLCCNMTLFDAELVLIVWMRCRR